MSKADETKQKRWSGQLLKSLNDELASYNESEIAPTGLEMVLGMIENYTRLMMTGIRAFYQMTPTRSLVLKETKSEKDLFSPS